MSRSFAKVLIANRGEIAVRIIRTCREMGIHTVAVYSDVDCHAMHVLMADEASLIGEAAARDSYLRADRIIEAAQRMNVDAIHPGYGFLAENPDFAEAVNTAGLIFIGPPAVAIKAMGSKTDARRIMIDAGVPVVPGEQSGLDSPEAAKETADRIGYPVLIKAAKGGGGKGMRIVKNSDEIGSAWEGARREAESAFGDGEVYIEKYIDGSRHVEVQILADSHGNCVHLYERECSIQRRHQKVIEEAPAVALESCPELRDKMGQTAVEAARACGYIGAGTVEFLFDPETSDYFFLEMNTRLQVEHPVTEMVTGIDLVREQILIAKGEELQIDQNQVAHRGHSIECRIYAEDPATGFLPDAGRIEQLVEPGGAWVRVDSGARAGDEIGVYYDPLIAKLIVWAPDRRAAIERMHRALGEYRIDGLKTTIPFARWAMTHPKFQSGDFDTGFIDQEFSADALHSGEDELQRIAAIVATIVKMEGTMVSPAQPSEEPTRSANGSGNPWKRAGRLDLMR